MKQPPDADRWRQISQLYHAARARDSTERAAFLSEACATDLALRHEVESLLARERSAEAFLTSPALELAAKI